MSIYLASVEDIKERTTVDINVSDKVVKNAIEDVQVAVIESLLGTELYERLLAGSLTVNYKTLGKNYILPVIVKEVEKHLLDILATQIHSNGISRNNGDNNQPATLPEIGARKRSIQKVADALKLKLKRYLSANSSSFPEYLVDSDLIDASDSAFDTILFFDDFEDEEEVSTASTTITEDELLVNMSSTVRKDFQFYQSDDIGTTFDIDTDTTDTPSLTGFTEIAWIIEDFNSNIVLEFKYTTASGSTDNSIIINNDIIELFKAFDSTDVIALAAGKYYHNFYMIDLEGKKKTYINGKFIYQSNQTV